MNAAELTTCEATIADLQAERAAAPTETKRQRVQAKINAAVARRNAIAEQAEANALDQLRATYRQLCQDAAAAAIARTRAKARRDQAASRYYKAHAEYLAADAVATALQRKVTFGFALQMAPEVRAALAPDMRAARAAAGLQPAPDRQYAEAT